ncbi:MAG: hypothetical protein MI723_03645 [Caulobacterales bacterium]|nr:hypothetical protein [Caulobacterales bacterium]
MDPSDAMVSPGADCIVLVEFRQAATGALIAEPITESASFDLLLELVNERDYLTFPMYEASFRSSMAIYELMEPCRSTVTMLAALLTEHNRRLADVRASFSDRVATRYDMDCHVLCEDDPYCWLGQTAASCPIADQQRENRVDQRARMR